MSICPGAKCANAAFAETLVGARRQRIHTQECELVTKSKQFFNKDWYYDNPLMPKNNRGMLKSIDLYNPELRKSYLPVPLFLTVDF
ncbi:MAG: hypothetical protein ACLUKN_06170 [Bacilli bacterium]